MTNLKKQLEEPLMQKIYKIITKTIEEKHELKLLEDVETDLENYVINDDEFSDYVDLVSGLLSFSGMTLSQTPMNNRFAYLEKCDFTKEDFFYYLTLENQIWKVLEENVLDKELVSDYHCCRLDNHFDDIMTDNRKNVYKFNFDQTEVWKELEPRIEKGIGDKGYLEKVKNWNKTRDSKKEEKGESIKKTPPEEITFSKQYREVFGDDDKIPEIPETKKKKEPHSLYWLKRELASAIGITICGRCGTRTKMIPTDEGLDEGWDGYATCPKCGQKEKWRIGE